MACIALPTALRHCLLALPFMLWAAGAQAFIDTPLDEAGARAMLNRFGFGADTLSLQSAVGMTPRQYLRRALVEANLLPEAIRLHVAQLPSSTPVDALWQQYGPGGSEKMQSAPTITVNGQQRSRREHEGRRILNGAVQSRLLHMANSSNPGHEALLHFWLNHFSIHGPKTLDKFLAADYARQIEDALRADSFPALLRASFLHPAMQIFLDNNQSTSPDSTAGKQAETRGKPVGLNENLARELLELHTLGVDGGYRQADILALARIISGAGVFNNAMQEQRLAASGAVRKGLFLFDPRRHDFGEKRLLGTVYPAGEGMAEIDRALDQLARHPATARHIANKLARRFLADTPPPDVVQAMADGFKRSGGRISETLLPLLSSPAFAASLRQPGKFKEPVDYLLSTARLICDGQPIGHGEFLMRTANDLDQAPFMRSTPDGYGSQESDWLSSAAMAKRVQLAQAAANGRLPLLAPPGEMGAAAYCRPQLANVKRLIGPLSASSQAALNGLSEKDQVTALLASPEFMRR